MKITMHKGWRLAHNLEPADATLLADKIIDGKVEVKTTLSNNQRSRVLLTFEKNGTVVVKYPLEKNKGNWIRFTTLFRSGEAFKNFADMNKLMGMGIPSTVAIMAGERRSFGMVVDSWLCYYYLEGRPCNEGDYAEVVGTLKDLHALKLVHGDPQIRNFLCHPTHGVCIIDCKPNYNYFGKLQEAYEMWYLAKSAPGIETYIDIRHTFLYRFAKGYDHFDRGMARWRRSIKRFLGLSKRK